MTNNLSIISEMYRPEMKNKKVSDIYNYMSAKLHCQNIEDVKICIHFIQELQKTDSYLLNL